MLYSIFEDSHPYSVGRGTFQVHTDKLNQQFSVPCSQEIRQDISAMSICIGKDSEPGKINPLSSCGSETDTNRIVFSFCAVTRERKLKILWGESLWPQVYCFISYYSYLLLNRDLMDSSPWIAETSLFVSSKLAIFTEVDAWTFLLLYSQFIWE